MFKRQPTAKAASPLRSSARRQMLAHLTSLYPILAHCPPETLAQVCPGQIKYTVATTQAGHKVAIHTNANGDSKPLWWEMGNDAGLWITSKSPAKTPELMPSLHTLWLVPNLLPIVTTWPQVVDPALLSGSALMVPGLRLPPHTYEATPAHPEYPISGQLVAIVAHPNDVPLVLARMELNMRDAGKLRTEGAKGKAAKVLHAVGDGLADMAGKSKAPDAVTHIAIQVAKEGSDMPAESTAPSQREVADVTSSTHQVNLDGKEGAGTVAPPESQAPPLVHFSAAEVDSILYVALLSALQSLLGGPSSAPSDIFPLSASAFYSSYVLPNRPSHWPPRAARGKRAKQAQQKGVPGSYGGCFDYAASSGSQERQVDSESALVAKTSAKKLAKWVKSVNRGAKGLELLRLKDAKGEVIVVGMNEEHADIRNLTPFMTITEHAALAEANKAASPTDKQSPFQNEQPRSSGAAAASAASTPSTQLYIERLFLPLPGNMLVQSFLDDVLHLPSKFRGGSRRDEYYSLPELRKPLSEHIAAECKPVKGNQAYVQPSPALAEVLGLSPATNASNDPFHVKSVKREELHSRFLSACFREHARVARLTKASASALMPGTSASVSSKHGPSQAPPLPSTEAMESMSASRSSAGPASLLSEGEYIGKPFPLPKVSPAVVGLASNASSESKALAHPGPGSQSSSPYKPIRIIAKKRQGKKVVTLITGLDVARIDAQIWGPEVMRTLGTSVSVSPLPTSSKGGGVGGGSSAAFLPHEVLIQGDQRVHAVDKLMGQNGVPRSAIDVEGMGGDCRGGGGPANQTSKKP